MYSISSKLAQLTSMFFVSLLSFSRLQRPSKIVQAIQEILLWEEDGEQRIYRASLPEDLQ